jgi:hypothetical protein
MATGVRRQVTDVSDAFDEVQREFPHYRIWQEVRGTRDPRYAAKARSLAVKPHTVVTADLAELRAELAASPPPVGGVKFDPHVAHPARVYAYWLGGKDYWPADQKAAEEVIQHRPEVVAGARANRNFLARIVGFMAAEHGIRQFLDIGTGLPAPDNTQDVAQGIAAECRVVFVDNDPMVLAHARALLTSSPEGACGYVDADLRDTATILREAAAVLDFDQPVGLLLLAVLHFISDADDPAGIVAALASKLAPGSFVALSHLTTDFAPVAVASGVGAYNTLVPTALVPRTHAEVAELFGGLPLAPPGVVPVNQWRPSAAFLQPADMYAGVAALPRQPR